MPGADSASARWWRGAVGVLVGAFLFNVGQGVLRPTLPLYLRAIFAANYRMITAIPTVFGLGKWVASLPTGHLLGRWGRRPLMVGGLLVIAFSDVASIMTPSYPVFLSFRALAGVGWAMFGTVATTVMVDLPAVQRRGRAVSVLMMSETSGLLLGSGAGGWLYQGVGVASPFVFEAACVLVAALFVARWALQPVAQGAVAQRPRESYQLGAVLRTPGVLVMSVINAVLTIVHVVHEVVQIAPRAGQPLPEGIGTDLQELGADRVGHLEDLAEDGDQALLAVETEQHAGRAAEARLVHQHAHVGGHAGLIGEVEIGRGVEAVAVALEARGSRCPAAALRVEHVVDGNPVQPRAKAAPPLERRQPGERPDQDLLGGVLGASYAPHVTDAGHGCRLAQHAGPGRQ